ncbi:MAG: hypothetical protein IJM28_02345 [Lachnospiraceae bacterium]|nr:hypothetical protein [Lachnospiraceae bacterium]
MPSKNAPQIIIPSSLKSRLVADFGAFGMFEKMRLIYYILQQRGSTSRYDNSSKYIATAFSTYDASFSPCLIDAEIEAKTLRHIIKTNDLMDHIDLVELIRGRSEAELDPLPFPQRKTFTFDDDLDIERELYEFIKEYMPKQRAYIIYLIMRNRIAIHGDSDYYDLAAERLLQQLVNCYHEERKAKKGDYFENYIKTTFAAHFVGEEEPLLKSEEKDKAKYVTLVQFLGGKGKGSSGE